MYYSITCWCSHIYTMMYNITPYLRTWKLSSITTSDIVQLIKTELCEEYSQFNDILLTKSLTNQLSVHIVPLFCDTSFTWNTWWIENGQNQCWHKSIIWSMKVENNSYWIILLTKFLSSMPYWFGKEDFWRFSLRKSTHRLIKITFDRQFDQ